jgi:hypothetical protein
MEIVAAPDFGIGQVHNWGLNSSGIGDLEFARPHTRPAARPPVRPSALPSARPPAHPPARPPIRPPVRSTAEHPEPGK